jgi:MOB kinase activator 1
MALVQQGTPKAVEEPRFQTVNAKHDVIFESMDSSPSLRIFDDSNNRTRNQFRPRPGGKAGATSYQLRQYAEATLGGGSLRKVVKLPEGEDENEWLAVNMVDFYNQINLLYGAITEFCSPQTCPEMKATDE